MTPLSQNLQFCQLSRKESQEQMNKYKEMNTCLSLWERCQPKADGEGKPSANAEVSQSATEYAFCIKKGISLFCSKVFRLQER